MEIDMTDDTPARHVRLPKQRERRPEPVEVKRCNACSQSLPLAQFSKRVNGGQGVAGTCRTCTTVRYETGQFTCSRCHQRLSGSAFPPGHSGAAISQPCKECRSSAAKAAVRIKQIEHGRSPYHLLSSIDAERRTATCRECGPTYIYSTGQASGCGWRCGRKSDQLSEAWYNARADIVDKHAAARWHRIRDVRSEEMRGTCSRCGDAPVRWNQASGHFTCASPARKRQHADIERRRRRLAQYGLTDDDYRQMHESQGGRCAICGGARVRSDSDGSLVVDHDHATGAVRALLCSLCNSGLGHFGDAPEMLQAAAQYLIKHRGPK